MAYNDRIMRSNNRNLENSNDEVKPAGDPGKKELFVLFGSSVRVKLLWEYIKRPKEWLGSRDLERLTGCSQSALHKQMTKLWIMGLLEPHISNDLKKSLRYPYRLKQTHPWIPGLRMIFEHAIGSLGILKEEMNKLISIDCVFVYGSFATSTQRSESDIDIVFIGHQSKRSLSKEISDLEKRINRQIDYKVYTPGIWKEKYENNDHFVRSLMSTQKVFLVGDNERLERITG